MLTDSQSLEAAGLDMKLQVLGADSQWDDYLSQEEESVGRIVHYLHDRHVGITRQLAVEAVTFASSGAGLWSDAAKLLTLAFANDATVRGTAAETLWRQAPQFVFVSRVVTPIVRSACERVGRSICFGETALEPSSQAIEVKDYEDYDTRLLEAVQSLLSQIDEMGERFWTDAAETLYGAIARRVGREAAHNVFGAARELTDIDTVLLSFLRELEPDFSRQQRRRFPDIPRTTRARFNRSGTKPKEGGVVGVRYSSSLGEIEDMLVSEYLNPRLMLADKLLNGTFLVRHRPPPRRPLRDALIVGVMLESGKTEAGRLVKAAWLNAAFRAALWLKVLGYGLSELRWIEHIGGNGFRSLRGDIASINAPPGDIWEQTNADVLQFFRSLMWLPSAIDRLPNDTLNPRVVVRSQDGGISDAHAAWISEGFAKSWESPASFTMALKAEEFSTVHAQFLCPDPSYGGETVTPQWSGESRRLAKALRLPSTIRHSVDLCFIPERLGGTAMRCWSSSGRDEPEIIGPVAMGNREDLARVYADMISWFLHQILNAVTAGGRNV